MSRINNIIFCIHTLLIISILHSCRSSQDRNEVIEIVNKNSNRFVQLADSMDLLIDTGFRAEYRIKPNKFYFQYLRPDNEIGNYFSVSDTITRTIMPISKQLGITAVLKFYNDNFLSFEMARSHTFKPLVLILKKNESAFEIRPNSRLDRADTTATSEELANVSGRSFIYKVNERIWVFFPANED